MEDRARQNWVFGFFLLLLVLLLAKLFHLQVVDKKYHSISSSVAVVEEEIIPSRGMIYDRNNKLIVFNAPVYDLHFSLNKMKDNDSIELKKFIEMDQATLDEKIKKAKEMGFDKKPFPLLKGLSEETYATIQENLYKYPYLSVKLSTQRNYHYPNAGSVLGYMGEVNQGDIDSSKEYYKPGDVKGKTGLESYYEDTLRGTKGVQYLLRDKNNVIFGKYKNGDFDVRAIPGQDLVTTLDIDLQKYAESLMNGKVGSLVAIEPKTGEIITMVSSPSFNPRWLSGSERSKYFNALRADSLKPLFNRAISAEYPPGSTFKPIASLIGLQTGSVTPDFRFPCAGGYSLNRGKPGCHSHAAIFDVSDAIRQSCNSYYAENFRRTMINSRYKNIRQSLDDWRKYMHHFGYDQTLDIGIPGVKSGFFPSSSYYDNIYKDWDWGPMTIISLSIGQGEILATTLQMAYSAAVIGSRGNTATPHLVKATSSGKIPIEKESVPIQKEYFDAVIDGMERTFIDGTASASKIENIPACGKTGTAENFAIRNGRRVQLRDHSLFIAFAPKENPKISLAVIIENGGFGSTYAAPIASLVIEKYLKDSIPENRKYLEKRMQQANLVGMTPGQDYISFVEEQVNRDKRNEVDTDSIQ